MTVSATGSLPDGIDGFGSLSELALDMRWSWNHSTDEMWRQLDPELWELTHNPWVVLQTASRDRIAQMLADPAFRKHADALVEAGRQSAIAPAWFAQKHSGTPLTSVAYFSMEFMLSEALPIYSGGLGNVAGDQLKAASDLGVPVVGIGLLYQQGYFRQVIDNNGEQQALYPYNDPGQLPVTPYRQANGEWMRLEIALPGFSVWLRVWQVQVGRVKLYLMDSNDAANFPAHRGITSELYGGGPELRLKQEMLLGLGGWRLLRALGIRPEICHLNEGHAAFAVLERARSFMEDTGQPFEVALAATRAGNLFTTHTAVAAGFDKFSPGLMAQYLGTYASDKLGISLDRLMALGRKNAGDSSEDFNMAYLAIRGSGSVNGVSRLHGQVSRRLFQPLFTRWPEDEVPIAHVTNGVHMPTWDSALADDLWTASCGKERWLGTSDHLDADIRKVPDAALWQFRTVASQSLVEYARRRLALELAAAGAPHDEVETAKHLFDPNALTLGFARRFATYKRANLLLADIERLSAMVNDPKRPVQFVFAGKAHPRDEPGKRVLQQIAQLMRDSKFAERFVFIEDYDINVGRHLVQGVDVWLNNPRRPLEASGTSGQKVVLNGGLNLSVLDGWWAEAYDGMNGFAIGNGRTHSNMDVHDSRDGEDLYRVLHDEVIPLYYQRDRDGLPRGWIKRMKRTIRTLGWRFNADRMVMDYTLKCYVPAAGGTSSDMSRSH